MFGHEMDAQTTPRSLLEVPANVACRVEWVGHAVLSAAHYALLGLRPGGFVRVLARFPEHQPRFVELEMERERISLPVSLASLVLASPV